MINPLALVLACLAPQAQDDEKELLKKILRRLDKLEEKAEPTKPQAVDPKTPQAPRPLTPRTSAVRLPAAKALAAMGHASGTVELGPDGKLTVRFNEVVQDGESVKVEEKVYSADGVKEFKEKHPEVAKRFGIGEKTLKLKVGDSAEAEWIASMGTFITPFSPQPWALSPGMVYPKIETPSGTLDDQLKSLQGTLRAMEERLKKLEKQ